MSFDSLGLTSRLAACSERRSVTAGRRRFRRRPSPRFLAGHDLLAGAQTGTGKTAAFVLPILQRLAEQGHPQRHPRALMLTPTRELAAQVGERVHAYGVHLPLRSAIVFGGVGMQPQVDRLQHGVDVLIATPGRLLDHAGRRTVDLSRVEILVLDEADRMLDMGFIHDIRRVLRLLPERRQNLLFSATYSDDIRRLADGLLQQPKIVEVARRNTAAEAVVQSAHPVDKGRKRDLLAHLIHRGGWEQVLVFTRTKHGANKLAEHLVRDGITRRCDPWQQEPVGPYPCTGRVQEGDGAGPGRDRYRRARFGYRQSAPSGEFRAAECGRRLCPSHRAHRPGRCRRCRPVLGESRRAGAARGAFSVCCAATSP